ncbi:hypothetical protein H0H92_003428 [Tricholoma furcatifolium]|nr:hypothetical protein H0H92_003428 [Tricholoma furcatifolium]
MVSNLEHSNLRASVAWNNGNPNDHMSMITHASTLSIRFTSDPVLTRLLQEFAEADLNLYAEKNMYFEDILECIDLTVAESLVVSEAATAFNNLIVRYNELCLKHNDSSEESPSGTDIGDYELT